METLANLESFVRSAETGSFSTTARRLSLTPAAVSRNVAMLERNLGVRLFHRSTRKLTLTEAGERFLHAIRDNLEELQASIASVATDHGVPTGVLKVSMGLTFGVDYIVPLLPAFLRRYRRSIPIGASRLGRWTSSRKGSTRQSRGASNWRLVLYRARSRLCTSLPSPHRTI